MSLTENLNGKDPKRVVAGLRAERTRVTRMLNELPRDLMTGFLVETEDVPNPSQTREKLFARRQEVTKKLAVTNL